MIIAIDGFAATGKSTLASMLACRLGFTCLNSGLIYRFVTAKLLESGIDALNFQNNLRKAAALLLDLEIDPNGLETKKAALQKSEIEAQGSQLAKIPLVREKVNGILRSAALNGPLIAEGRDIGTLVFPEADLKFFFTANIDVRVSRVANDRGGIDPQSIRLELDKRDHEDASRAIAPLKKAVDAIEIDTTYLSIAETLSLLEKHFYEHRK